MVGDHCSARIFQRVLSQTVCECHHSHSLRNFLSSCSLVSEAVIATMRISMDPEGLRVPRFGARVPGSSPTGRPILMPWIVYFLFPGTQHGHHRSLKVRTWSPFSSILCAHRTLTRISVIRIERSGMINASSWENTSGRSF